MARQLVKGLCLKILKTYQKLLLLLLKFPLLLKKSCKSRHSRYAHKFLRTIEI